MTCGGEYLIREEKEGVLVNQSTKKPENRPVVDAKDERSLTSITGQTTVVGSRAIRSRSGSNQPEPENVTREYALAENFQ